MCRRSFLKLFRKKKTTREGTVGVGLSDEGAALARVVYPDGNRPRLAALEFVEGQALDNDKLLSVAARRLSLAGSRTIGVLPPNHYSLLQIDPPQVPAEELNAAVRWQIHDLIDYPVDEAVVDLCPLPERTRGQSAYAVSARRSEVDSHVRKLLKAGLELAAMDIPELAMRNIAAQLPEDDKGCALLYLGPDSGLITLTRGGKLYLARKINIGLTSLAQLPGSGPAMDAAENPDFFDLLDNIVLEIQRSLDFYESNFSRPAIGDLVVAPMVQDLPVLINHLRTYLVTRVRQLDLAEILDTEPLDRVLQAQALLAVGGALRNQEAS